MLKSIEDKVKRYELPEKIRAKGNFSFSRTGVGVSDQIERLRNPTGNVLDHPGKKPTIQKKKSQVY